jgi:putative salt-induced outer membrane protein YdiY
MIVLHLGRAARVTGAARRLLSEKRMKPSIFAGALPALCLVTAVASAARITLSNGDQLSGELLAESADAVTLRHAVLGEISIPRGQIAALQAEAGEQPTATGDRTAAVDSGLLGTGWLTDWQRRVEIGVTGAAGKSDNLKVNAGFKADYEDEQTRWAHQTAYYRNDSEGTLSDHSLFSTLNRDWLRPGSPWFQFAGGRFDWDEFKDWDYRLAANGGVGYEFVKTDSYRLLGRAGLGGNQTFGGTREEFTPEALLGIEVAWKISERQSFAFTNTLHPSLSESGEFRNATTLDWTLDLDQEAGLGLKIGLSNEYDSLTEDGVDKNDFKYTGSLVWSL